MHDQSGAWTTITIVIDIVLLRIEIKLQEIQSSPIARMHINGNVIELDSLRFKNTHSDI